ncbi:hypothetical protein SAMN05216350_107190 [Polaromonas sp. YR568]|nr:hypothetical protein SAMN05216350_107190 [Polaromonas sp. YR568]
MFNQLSNTTYDQSDLFGDIHSLSYYDSIELQQRTYYSPEFLNYMETHCGSTWGPRWVNLEDRGGFAKLWIHQPSRKAIEYLRGHHCRVTRVHVALDVMPGSKIAAKALQEQLARTFVLSNLPYDEVRWVRNEDRPLGDSTCYFGYSRPWGPGKTAALYADRLSKVAKRPCCHLEVRVALNRALNAYSLRTPDELLILDHRKFWERRLTLLEPPKVDVLGGAWARQFLRRRTLGSRRWPYGGRAAAILRTGTLLLRAAQGRDGNTNVNDLLYFLRSTGVLGERKITQLFQPVDASWLLPSSANAMWASAKDHMNQHVSDGEGAPSHLSSFSKWEIPY